ncbi:MAG: hypothetical protein K1X74_12465 [Pirellulales bacterium]|nr:hypothetical protein [Pirellulales bacterium]
MNKTSGLLVLVLLALATGCRNNRAQTAVHDQLYSELRMWEDEVGMLEDELSESEARLESCRRENAALRQQLGTRGGDEAVPADDSAPGGAPPSIEIPQGSAPSLSPPSVPSETYPPNGTEDAPPYVPPGAPDERLPDPPSARHHQRSPRGGVRAPQVSLTPRQDEAEITDWQVHEITLNRQLTGGHNRDGHPGDEGIMVVIEPRNKAGQILEVPGEVSVVLTDPSRSGPASRVARWDFTMSETADRFRQSIVGKGIHVELPWPAEPPVGRTLNLYVRYQTDDGRKLLAERQIQIDPLPPQQAVRDPSRPHTAPTGRAAQRYGEAWGALRGRAPQVVTGQPALGQPRSEPPTARTARVERVPYPIGAGADQEFIVEEHIEGDHAVDGEVVHEGELDHEGETPADAAPSRRKPQWSPDRM